jgi:ADP-ribose pyrophosphatase
MDEMFKGRVFRVERGPITLPNGRDVTIEVVRHRGSVVLLAQPDPESIIVIRQYRPVIGRWIWEVPAGSLDEGELPDVAAVRECEEEIGWTPQQVRLIGSWYPTPGFCDEIMHFYHCTSLVTPAGPVHQDLDEVIESSTVSLDALARMIDDRRVVDMKTVMAYRLLRP